MFKPETLYMCDRKVGEGKLCRREGKERKIYVVRGEGKKINAVHCSRMSTGLATRQTSAFPPATTKTVTTT